MVQHLLLCFVSLNVLSSKARLSDALFSLVGCVELRPISAELSVKPVNKFQKCRNKKCYKIDFKLCILPAAVDPKGSLTVGNGTGSGGAAGRGSGAVQATLCDDPQATCVILIPSIP